MSDTTNVTLYRHDSLTRRHVVCGVGHAVGLEYLLHVPQSRLGPRRPAVLILPIVATTAAPHLPHVQLARAEQIGWKERHDDRYDIGMELGALALVISVGDYVAHSVRTRNTGGLRHLL